MIDVESALERASAALAVRRPDEARRVLAPVVAADPSNARALVLLGHAAVAAGDHDDAMRKASQAAGWSDGDPDILVGCAYVAYHCGDDAAAYHWGRSAWASSPDAVGPHLLLALVAGRVGRTEEAVAHGRAAVASAPDDPDALVALGHALRSGQAVAEATVQYVTALAVNPLHLDALSGLGLERATCGDLRRCATYWGRVLELDPNYGYGLANLDAGAAGARMTILSRVAVTALVAWCASLLGSVAVTVVLAAGLLWIVGGLVLLPTALRRRLLSRWQSHDWVLVAVVAVGLIVFPLLVLGVALLASQWLHRWSTWVALRRAGLALPRRG